MTIRAGCTYGGGGNGGGGGESDSHAAEREVCKRTETYATLDRSDAPEQSVEMLHAITDALEDVEDEQFVTNVEAYVRSKASEDIFVQMDSDLAKQALKFFDACDELGEPVTS